MLPQHRIDQFPAAGRTGTDGDIHRAPATTCPWEWFVVRIIEGDAGVLFTADSMDVAAFEEAATAVRRLLAEQ